MAEERARACPKDCRQCSMPQQIYCTTSLMFNSYEMMGKMVERLEAIENKVNVMQGAKELVTPNCVDERVGNSDK